MYDLGLLLRNLRKQHGYSQADVGQKLNVSALSVSRWELNAKKPTTSHLIELAMLFNISFNYLIDMPKEDILVIEKLAPDQQNLMWAITNQFNKQIKGTRKITPQQQQILNSLLEEFSR